MHARTITTALTDCHMHSGLLMCAMCYSMQINRGFVCLFWGFLWAWFQNVCAGCLHCIHISAAKDKCSVCLFVFSSIPHKYCIDFHLFLSKGNSACRWRDEAHGECVFVFVNLWWKILMYFFPINICLHANFAREQMRIRICNGDDKNVSFPPPLHYLSQCFMEYKMTKVIVYFWSLGQTQVTKGRQLCLSAQLTDEEQHLPAHDPHPGPPQWWK